MCRLREECRVGWMSSALKKGSGVVSHIVSSKLFHSK